MIQIYEQSDTLTKLTTNELFGAATEKSNGMTYSVSRISGGISSVTVTGTCTLPAGYTCRRIVVSGMTGDYDYIRVSANRECNHNNFYFELSYKIPGDTTTYTMKCPDGTSGYDFWLPSGATFSEIRACYFVKYKETVNTNIRLVVYRGLKDDRTRFDSNGDCVLFPNSCELEMNLNGDWDLEMVCPFDDDGKYKLIKENSVLSVPTPVSDRQLFRIYKTKKTQSQITAYARPIFMDAQNDVFILDSRPTDKTGQEALDILTEGTIYSGESNIATTSTAYYVNKNLIQALQSDDDNSFLNRWGGEIIYDNFKVIINTKTGADNGLRAEFGRNLESIQETIDMDNVITRIVPQSYNGYMLSGSSPWVDSPNIDKYPVIRTKVVKFSDVKLTEDASSDDEVTYDTLDELRDELKRRAEEQFELGVDVPSINYNIDLVDLSKMEEYKDYQALETISLGDTIHCKYKPLDIETTARVIRLKYDCILKKNIEEELGDETYDYFSDLSTTADAVEAILNDNGTVRGEAVQGVLDALNTKLSYQKSATQKQDVRAILFEDLDESSPTYGALAIGTLGLQISTKRTEDGNDWVWTTAITAQGAYADIIAAGTMLADRIKGGTLSLGGESNQNGEIIMYDEDGKVIGTWDENGLNATKGTFSGTLISAGGMFSGKFMQVINNSWGTEYVTIDNGIIEAEMVTEETSSSGGTTTVHWGTSGVVGQLDLCAQYSDGSLKTTLKSAQSDLMLQAPNGRIVAENMLRALSGLQLWGLTHISEASSFLTFESDGQTVAYHASSSKRYKDIGNPISDDDLSEWYKIQPVWAKYKDGYLKEDDGHNGKYLPMFIAEDVEEHLPEAASHLDGKTEDWNFRIMIPAMFEMIRSQKRQIDELKTEVENLKSYIKE